MLTKTAQSLRPALARGFRSTVASQKKVVCVLYDDPKTGYPPKYARDDLVSPPVALNAPNCY